MRTLMGKPIPVVKPFECNLSLGATFLNLPAEKVVELRLNQVPIKIHSTPENLFVNEMVLEDWVDKEMETINLNTVRKYLKTMVISALYAEDKYTKEV